jgi:predicted O-methyltransferase YrrM
MNKIFNIGFNKSGTTSLTKAMNILGFRSVHSKFEGEKMGTIIESNILNNQKIMHGLNFDFYSDFCGHIDYKALDEQYPKNKFILTVRDMEEWLASKKAHSERKKKNPNYKGKWIVFDRDRNRNRRMEIESEIREYFKGRPDDLLILDICGGDGWEKLCNFLSLPIPSVDFPFENAKSDKLKTLPKKMNKEKDTKKSKISSIFQKFKEVQREIKQIKERNKQTPNFLKIKRQTNGMMGAQIYREIYLQTLIAQDGKILDIGTGRGASTISIALGIKQSNKNAKIYCIDQFFQHTAKHPHKYTMEKNPDNCIKLNLEIFLNNLKQYGVYDIVTVLEGKTTHAAERLQKEKTFSLLFIDVDGCIDRDFNLFYNLLLPGAIIIIDDYANIVNSHGKKYLEEYCQLNAEKRKLYIKNKNPEEFSLAL